MTLSKKSSYYYYIKIKTTKEKTIMQKHAYQVTYEILHFNKDGNPVQKMWGRTIKNGYGLTEDKACSRNFYERGSNDKVVILESEKISMERYNQLLAFDESKLAEIQRHHRMGIE